MNRIATMIAAAVATSSFPTIAQPHRRHLKLCTLNNDFPDIM